MQSSMTRVFSRAVLSCSGFTMFAGSAVEMKSHSFKHFDCDIAVIMNNVIDVMRPVILFLLLKQLY